MRIIVFGAAGNVGRRVVAEANARGHAVTAVTRRPESLSRLPVEITSWVADARSAETIARLSAEQDLVVSATRPAPGQEAELLEVAKAMLEGTARSGKRLLMVGGAASLKLSSGGLVFDDPRHVPSEWKAIAAACMEQLLLCRTHPLADWTYISPPAAIEAGQRTGRYRTGQDFLVVDERGRSQISFEDFAVAILDEIERPRHQRSRFTVAY